VKERIRLGRRVVGDHRVLSLSDSLGVAVECLANPRVHECALAPGADPRTSKRGPSERFPSRRIIGDGPLLVFAA
jgi:hypothetical protein